MDDDDDDHNDDDDDDDDEVVIQEKDNTLSPSSSLTSGTDVYMDAVEILNDEYNDNKSGTKKNEFSL